MKQVFCALGAVLVVSVIFLFANLAEIEADFSTANVGTSVFVPGKTQALAREIFSKKPLPPPQTNF